MASKREKRKKGGARQTATTFMKKLKKGKGERVRHKKGASDTARVVSRTSPELRGLSTSILNFDGRKIVLECGAEFNTGFLPPDDVSYCTRAKGHDTPHGEGNGLDIEQRQR